MKTVPGSSERKSTPARTKRAIANSSPAKDPTTTPAASRPGAGFRAKPKKGGPSRKGGKDRGDAPTQPESGNGAWWAF